MGFVFSNKRAADEDSNCGSTDVTRLQLLIWLLRTDSYVMSCVAVIRASSESHSKMTILSIVFFMSKAVQSVVYQELLALCNAFLICF